MNIEFNKLPNKYPGLHYLHLLSDLKALQPTLAFIHT